MLKSPVERADELLAQMTLAEKARQVGSVMSYSLSGMNGLDPAALDRHLADGIGHVAT